MICVSSGRAWLCGSPKPKPQIRTPAASAMTPASRTDTDMLIQAQDILQLTDEQFPKFMAHVRTWQETRRRTQGERLRMVQELRRMINGRGGPIDEGTVKERLKALDELEARANGEIQQQRDTIDQVLNPIQQARFRVFEETMVEERLRRKVGRQ